MKTEPGKSRRLIGLSWAMYVLATLLLIASILLGLSVSGASAAIPAATIGFQSPALKPVWDALVSGLQLLGVLVFGGGLTLATMVFGVGLLIGRIASLECRISQLERTGSAEPDPPADACHRTSLAATVQIEQT